MIAATEDLLGVLKYALLALLYLFFARVLWAVWSEVRGTNQRAASARRSGPVLESPMPNDPTVPIGGFMPASPPMAQPMPQPKRQPKPKAKRGKRGTVGRLVITEPRVRRGSAYPVGPEITVGRAETCSIPIPEDTFASQLHARVLMRDAAVWLEDLGSTNGTFLNGRRIDVPEMLSVGDRVQIGQTTFEAG